MKKLIIILFAILLLSSCDDKHDTHLDSSSENNEDSIYYGDYQMGPDDFNNIIKNNPIDREYDIESEKFQTSKEFSTFGWVQLEDKYYGIWKDELNEIIKKLKMKLSDDEYKLLEASQKGWETYHLKELEFMDQTFLSKGYFGTQGYVTNTIVKRERIRQRTIQLMEYYFELNDYQLDFLYKGK
ncbi:lysozyme inhibitor LprI family protein [Paenibacillus durus]|uniref:Lysozyme inhibitor LprI-like N-terminal domain-containing protein n=1 Tax=Paenibacillus durus TaxID=44251 RepID=A0A089HQL3_PAEDU|nr:lysozyme inhibitor LprI family protein [Paenibacillus durus]AIQ14301.1 hypothetical protein PDUR_22135 [Paenibacillus durus]